MLVVKQVFVALSVTVCTCYATSISDLQRYEEKVKSKLATEGPGPYTDWQMYEAAVEMLAAEANKSHIEELQTSAQVQSTGGRINCTVENSTTVPTSVHQLRPSDIKVVAAMGDSLTAANCAMSKSIFGFLRNYRGVSWSIGGEKDLDTYLTLPNILKKFNPDVKGFSTGNGRENSRNAKLNVAVYGASAGDMVKEARKLIDKIKDDKDIDFDNDWKLVTMLIGANDLLDYCYMKEKYTAEFHMENIKAALDVLHENLPRTFVNVATVMNVSELSTIPRTWACDILHFIPRTLRCVSYGSYETLVELQAMNRQYVNLTHQLIDSGRYDDKEDFTVVIQPFFEEAVLAKNPKTGKVDPSFFGGDCFHFSQRSHASSARLLWNNMLEPVGNKTKMFTLDPLQCPTQDRPYLATAQNSITSFASASQESQNDNIRPVSGPSAAVIVGCLVLVCVAVGGAGLALRRRKQLKDQDILRKPLLQKPTDMASTLVLT